MPGWVWVQSSRSIVPVDQAKVSYALPGVLYGESLFETFRVREGRIFRLHDHLRRLRLGLGRLGWHADALQDAEIRDALRALLACLGPQPNARVRLTAFRSDEEGNTEYLLHATPYTPPAPSHYAMGVRAHLASPRIPASAPWSGLKVGSRLPYRVAQDEAQRVGAWEALLLNTDGLLADGAITNVHFADGDYVHTPAPTCGPLPGIAQAVVKEIAHEAGVSWVQGEYPPDRLLQAPEAFLTNAMIGVLPLVAVDTTRLGCGEPGRVTRLLAKSYEQRVMDESQIP